MGILRKIFGGGGGSIEQGGSAGVDYGTGLDPLKVKPEPKPLSRKALMAQMAEEEAKLKRPIKLTPPRGVKSINEEYPTENS